MAISGCTVAETAEKSAKMAVQEPRRACCAVPSGSSLLILGGVQNEVRGSPGSGAVARGVGVLRVMACLFSPWVPGKPWLSRLKYLERVIWSIPIQRTPLSKKNEQITRGLEESKWEYDTV